MLQKFNPFDKFNKFGNKFGNRLARSVSRSFTELVSVGSQHYTIPSVTVDRIVMDVYSPTGSNTGLPTGAPTPTANKLETLDFVYSGSISEIGKNGAAYFDGMVANVKAYNSGTLIRDYPLDEGMSTGVISDHSGNDQHGTAVNITDADAEKYIYEKTDNEWLGQELVVNGGFDTDTDWNTAAGWSISGGELSAVASASTSTTSATSITTVGLMYRIGVTARNITLSSFRVVPGWGGLNAPQIVTDGDYSYPAECGGNGVLYIQATGVFSGSVDNVSCKRLLEVA